ncbi:hypothetical protein [Robiginitalea sp.]|uniref:hypothetical protein n=1 Tax=Robiginitalea sp. TaxID=1902411 RepID=UPI003C75473C
MKMSIKYFTPLVALLLAVSLNSCKQETKDKLKDAEEAVVEETKQAAEKVGEAAESAGDAVKEAAGDVADAVEDGIEKVRVKFEAGTSSKTVESSITGRETVDYLLNVKKGQPMNISMATQNTSAYFNIMEPGEQNEAIYNGSINGNQFEGTAAESGDYTIRVYMMRSAARRGEKADYRLEMIVGN